MKNQHHLLNEINEYFPPLAAELVKELAGQTKMNLPCKVHRQAEENTDLLRCVWSLLNGLWFCRFSSVLHCVYRVRNTSISTSSRIAGPLTQIYSYSRCDLMSNMCDKHTALAAHDNDLSRQPQAGYQALVCPEDWWGCEMASGHASGCFLLPHLGPCPARSPPLPKTHTHLKW